MLKVFFSDQISDNNATIVASGDVETIAADVATVINAIYTQFQAASPSEAEVFRSMIEDLVSAPNSPLWEPQDGQIGYAIHRPEG